TNAIKYSPNAGEIIVTLSADKDNVIVSVQDFGIGISKQHTKRIFDRFFRAENAVKEGIAGFGLGLYIVAQIVQQQHGKIWVKSVVGKGSTFYFSLPIATDKMK